MQPAPGGWLAAVVLGLLVACGPPAPPTTVRVGVLGSIDELPLFVIQAQGLDRRHGLRLEHSTHMGGARILEAMATGSVDFSFNVGTVPLLLAAERGFVPERAVAVAVGTFADREHPGVGVVVAATVKAWAGLSRQLIGIYAVESLGGAALKARLAHEGVRDYRLVEIAMPNLGLALAGGTVTAVAMPEPYVTQSVLRKDGQLLGWVIGDRPMERMVYTVVAARTQFYREQRDVVKALLRANLDAMSWIEANPERARAIMAERLGITEELGRRIHLLRWVLDGRNDARLFNATQDVLIQAGVLGGAIPLERVFETGALDDVLRERGR
jgi:NitT/TauT family transport system substrate-binding protein